MEVQQDTQKYILKISYNIFKFFIHGQNTYVRGAILFGEKKQIGNDLVIFIRGAIEGQNLELDLDETVFDDEVWREIYQQKERLFSGLDVIGWALLRMGFSVRLNDKIKRHILKIFQEKESVIYDG